MSTLPLFEPPVPPFRARLAEALARLAADGVLVGTSSWKYEGWLGQVYTEERYHVRGGRFSKRLFEETCLAEYAETFPVVCGDFSFYQFPSEHYWRKLFGSAASGLRFVFKVPEEITVKVFPSHERYGVRAGQPNDSFLEAALLAETFLKPLAGYRERVAALLFEFGAFPRGALAGPEEFLDRLARFLAALPAGFRYAVEVRNPDFLGPDYFGVLRRHGVAHVFSAWTRMPELATQLRIPGAFTADFTLTRALLRQGRAYEQAVRLFEPYREIRDENPAARQAVRELIGRARQTRQPAFVFVNNRLEGNAPLTISAMVEERSAE